MLSLQKTENPDYVVILGDLFHTHSVVRVEVLNRWLDYLRRSTHPHILIKGNHDETSPGSNEHALVGLSNIDGVTVVDEPMDVGRLSFIQYVHHESEFASALNKVSGDYLFCHQTFQGAHYDNGFYAPDGFSADLVSRFDQVICGHIHARQNVGSNIVYVGSPYATSFNDVGEEKGLVVWEDGNIRYVDSPCPKYHQIEVSVPEDVPQDFLESNPKDNFKVVLHAPRSVVSAYAGSKEFTDLKKRFKITFSPKITDQVTRERQLDEGLTVKKMLDSYVKEILETSLDKERLQRVLSDILEESELK